MVLTVEQLISAYGFPVSQVTSFKIPASAYNIKQYLFNLCEACGNGNMASIPPSAFSAGRIRATQQRDMKISKTSKFANDKTKYHDAAVELSPHKYTSALMNSIWGFYNRYSPHNVKKVAEANNLAGELPQNSGNSSSNNDFFTFPREQLGKIWKKNMAQSN